eukprot:7229779-Pyramimonas_sp.AAC.1
MMVNPAYRPNADDGSNRYRVVRCKTARKATCVTPEALERQRVRNYMRTQPVLCYSTEAEFLSRTLYRASVSATLPKEKDQRQCSEWLTTASRHKPFHRDDVSHRFTECVTSIDVFDGWVNLSGLLENWPPETHETW